MATRGPAKGEPCLNKCGEDKAIYQLGYLLRQAGVVKDPMVVRALARATIKSYLKGVKQATKEQSRSSPIVVELMAMAPGDMTDIDAVARQTVHGYFRAARARLKEPDAKWQMGESPEPFKIRIHRLENGARILGRAESNPRAAFLASIPIGQAKTDAALFANRRLEWNEKAMARRLVGNPSAKWACRTTIQGLQIRRIS